MTQIIYHLATADDATRLAQSGTYSAASLDTEGFIHCCTATQMAGVIQRYYADAEELVVLSVDQTLLDVEIKFENTVGGEELFPHVYGAIQSHAVVGSETMDASRIKSIATSGRFAPINQSN